MINNYYTPVTTDDMFLKFLLSRKTDHSSPLSLLDEFRSFALTHPEYAKLFTTYIELQRYQALQGEDPEHNGTSHASNASQEDSASDKKDDW